MKRRDFLITSAVLPLAATAPSWALAKASAEFGRPTLAETANFQRNVTILGTSNPEWRSDYVVDLYRRAKTLYDTRDAWDMFGVGPSVAFGNKSFHDSLAEARPVPNFYLSFYVFDMTTKPTLKDREGAVFSAMRSNSPLVMLEDLQRPERLVPSVMLPRLFMSGTHVAGGLTAPTAVELFEKVANSLGVDSSDYHAQMWAVAPHGGQSQVQVFFDGRDVTQDYIAWLAHSTIQAA